MFDKLLLKTYLYTLFKISKDTENLSGIQLTLNDFLYLFLVPNLNPIEIRDLFKQIENYFGFHTEINNKVQIDRINIDNKIVIKSLSLILRPTEKDIFSIHYEETQEGGFLIPNLIVISSTNMEKISRFILLDDFLPVETALINEQWTRATNGGKIQIKDNRITFRLAGLKLPEKKKNFLNEIIPDASSKSTDELESIIQNNLQRWNSNKIIDVQSSFNSIWDSMKSFVIKNEKFEINIDSFLPVVVLPELTFSSVILCAISPLFTCAYPKSGILDMGYDTKDRNLSMEIILKTDAPFEYSEKVYKILGYLIEQLNGTLITEKKQIKNEYVFGINIHIPDKIGIYLDKELPGWDCLSSESKDLLRRLCNDFSIPYENHFISEILKYEVENNFNHIFSLSLFINLAHEVLEQKQKSINSTLRSILTDIEKGKVKKKLLNPVIVGQIIESCLNLPNGEERIFKLFNKDKIQNKQLLELTKALKQFPQSTQQLLPLLVSFIQKIERPK